MGFFGGLLGIGGSVVMIPAMVIIYGENQHLYQASAMICNFFVGGSAVLVHKRGGYLNRAILKYLIPSAALGILAGVAMSNSSFFAGGRSYLLARIFGLFMVYVIFYNLLRFSGTFGEDGGFDITGVRYSVPLLIFCGLLTGVPAGLLGIGGGVLCVPAQQLFLRMPLKRAIANSAATIVCIALVGAFYKNITLAEHNIAVVQSLKMAGCIIPGAIAGAFLGSKLLYKAPKNLVRVAFILLASIACYELLTV